MKKYLIALVGLFLFVSCEEINSGKKEKFDIIEFDGCEYIEEYTSYGYYVHTHKGNCKNTIHVYNEKSDTLIIKDRVYVPIDRRQEPIKP